MSDIPTTFPAVMLEEARSLLYVQPCRTTLSKQRQIVVKLNAFIFISYQADPG